MSKPPRAPLHDLTPEMTRALCMLAGGAMDWHRTGWVDVVGDYHLHRTLDALVRRDLAEFYGPQNGKARLTDPRGRWFACTALTKAAELLLANERKRDERRARKIYNPPHWVEIDA